MRNPVNWIILLAFLMPARGSFAEHEYKFTLADIEPYVIWENRQLGVAKGLQVELLQTLAKKIGHRISFVPIPTRRYLTGAFKPIYDGAIYSDLLIENLPALRENYDVIEPLFQSSMFLFRRTQLVPLPPSEPIPDGTVGQVGDSCGAYLKKGAPYLKKFDIKDPEQGVLMLSKGRLDYLCLSDIVVYRLMNKQSIRKSDFEMLRDLGGFHLVLLLRKDLADAEKEAYREAVRTGLKNGSFQELFQQYNVRNPVSKH